MRREQNLQLLFGLRLNCFHCLVSDMSGADIISNIHEITHLTFGRDITAWTNLTDGLLLFRNTNATWLHVTLKQQVSLKLV